MNDRKLRVIKMAHQLFIDKGFQATSIQDILDYSGIAKGTFYNYFSSKNELFIALFKTIHSEMEKSRNDLLIGQDPSDIDIFIKQLEFQMVTNRKNKLVTLFEEVLVSNDEDLKKFIQTGQLRILRWVHKRFTDIFGKSKEPYLLDCSIMFLGILHQNLKYSNLSHDSTATIQQVVRYCVKRLVKMVEDVAESDEQLFHPELLKSWLPDCNRNEQSYEQKLYHTVLTLKKSLNHNKDQAKYIELLDFIQDELLHSKKPRRFLIESAIFSLEASDAIDENAELKKLRDLVKDYFLELENETP